jgi:hypothetical protein
MTGTLVNLATVAAGSAVGFLLGDRLPERVNEITMQAVGAVTLLIGFQMAQEAQSGPQVITVLISLAVGSIIGELLDIEGRLDRVGQRLEKCFSSGPGGTFTRAFVTASLLFCVGPMTVLGAIQDGLLGDPTLLLTKATLDGISAVALTAALGIGTFFSTATILVYQGGITLLAGLARNIMQPMVVQLLSSVGGLMIIGLGVNIWELTKLRVANMLPALVIIVLTVYAAGWLGIAL